jgi:signal transduction histidine kinase
MELDHVPTSSTEPALASERSSRRAQSELERASRLVLAGELVAAVTHDLRQPLTALEMNVAAAVALLRRATPAVGDALGALDDVLAQVRRMSDALQALQDLVVRREPRRERCDVAAAIRDVVTLVQGEALARHVAIASDIAADTPAIHGDAVLLRQALLNILADALEATSSSAHRDSPVSITARAAGDVVDIRVTHFGVRADNAGLDEWGLALARSVVAAHGATITLTGAPDTGVTVATRWPAHAG